MNEPSTPVTVDETQFLIERNPATGYIRGSIIGKGSVDFARAMSTEVQRWIDEQNAQYWLINLEQSYDPPNKEERKVILNLLKANPDCRFAQYGGSHIIAAVVRFAIAAMGPHNTSQFATEEEAIEWLKKEQASVE